MINAAWVQSAEEIARREDTHPQMRYELSRILMLIEKTCEKCPFRIDRAGCAFKCYLK